MERAGLMSVQQGRTAGAECSLAADCQSCLGCLHVSLRSACCCCVLLTPCITAEWPGLHPLCVLQRAGCVASKHGGPRLGEGRHWPDLCESHCHIHMCWQVCHEWCLYKLPKRNGEQPKCCSTGCVWVQVPCEFGPGVGHLLVYKVCQASFIGEA
jgi:hypothetical protein